MPAVAPRTRARPHMQHLPARDEQLELRTGREQIRHLRCRLNHLLEVVQEEQHLLLLQHLYKPC